MLPAPPHHGPPRRPSALLLRLLGPTHARQSYLGRPRRSLPTPRAGLPAVDRAEARREPPYALRQRGPPGATHRLLRLPSSGRVSATDVHDAGRRRGGLEPIDDVPCVVEGGSSGPLKRKAVEEGNGLRSAAATAPALAYGYLVLESGRDVLLPVLVSGWCEPRGGSLGDSRIDDGSGCGVHLGASEGVVPGCAASNHLGQRSSVHREGLQDVHPHLRNDAREDGAVLPAIERKDRTLAQNDKIGCPASCQPQKP